MACHDGTVTTTYDVAGGHIGDPATGPNAFGGAFGTTGGSASNHNVTGSMDIAAAPGGSTVASSFDATGKATNWKVEFGCESCHTPHGLGGNARILNPDPNNAATTRAIASGYNDANAYATISTKGLTATLENGAYVVRPAVTAESAVNAAYNGYYFLSSYPYSVRLNVNGAVYAAGGNFTVDNSAGYTKITVTNPAIPVASGVKIIGVPSMKVTMKISNYLQADENVEHVSGMNPYCGACHTDYNTAIASTYLASGYNAGGFSGSGKIETGVFSQAHRHQVGFQWHGEVPGLKFEKGQKNGVMSSTQFGMECLTCHVAHGVNQDYWSRTLIEASNAPWSADPGVDLTELAGSSALKRMPNMGTCEACHAKGVGNQGYASNSGQNPNPLGADAVVANAGTPNIYNLYAVKGDYAPSDLDWVGSEKCVGCHKEYVDGWEATMHRTSSHEGSTPANEIKYGCNSCHNPGNTIINTGTFAKGQVDSGITCEACHGTGKNHILAPTAKNIFNPGATSVERQAIECGKCHDMFNNTTAIPDTYGLATVSGMSYDFQGANGIGKAKLSALVNKAGWSVAYRSSNNDPAKFADATQVGATSTHFGGAWGYADSKHFKGTGTSENPNGIVSCNTCHDMHSDKNTGLLKYGYEQVCSSCHDAGANLAIDVAMPTNNQNRHQIEANDFAHSFKFGAPATVAAVTIETVNLENAYNGLANMSSDSNTFYAVWDAAYGTKLDGTKDAGQNNLWRSSQTGGGGIGQRILAYSSTNKIPANRVYNNYAMDWKVVSKPATVTEGIDFVMVPEGGALEFTNPGGALSNYTKFSGVYTLKYTNRAYPAVTGTVSFTVKQTPLVP